MIVTGHNLYRVLADGLICRAEELPRRHPGAQCLRDAAASLLDADMHLNAANDQHEDAAA
jgi:hypothetical protein